MIDVTITRMIGSIVTVLSWAVWCLAMMYKCEGKIPAPISDRLMSIAITTFLMGNWLAILWLKF